MSDKFKLSTSEIQALGEEQLETVQGGISGGTPGLIALPPVVIGPIFGPPGFPKGQPPPPFFFGF